MSNQARDFSKLVGGLTCRSAAGTDRREARPITDEKQPAAPAREVLLAEQARARERVAALAREFAGLAEAASSGGTDDEHDPEGATLAFERQHAAALLEAAREQVAAFDVALARLAEGRYGSCDRCGQPIGADRLAARPAARTCIDCAAGRRR